MTIVYTALKTELTTDPKAYGYAAPFAAGSDATVAGILNVVRAGEQIAQAALSSADIFNAIAPTEWTATNMVLLKFQYLQILMEVGSAHGVIDLSNGNVKAALDLIFPVATCPLTNAAHHALYTRNGTRAETLFGAGTFIQPNDIGLARTS